MVTRDLATKMCPYKKYVDYHGSTLTDMMMVVNLPSYDSEEVWHVTQQQKIAIYTHPSDGPRRVSMTSPGDASNNIADDAMEVAFYHALPYKAWKNFFDAWSAKGIIDLAAGSGECIKAALLLKKPCLAFCLSEKHAELLMDHLVVWMQQCMLDSNNPLFDPKYRSSKLNTDAKDDKPNKKDDRKRKKDDPKKDKNKRQKKDKAESSSGSSSSDE